MSEENNNSNLPKINGMEEVETPELGSKEQTDTTTRVISDAPKEEAPVEKMEAGDSELYVIRTTANREDQVFDFLQSNIEQKGINIYSIIRTHGMRGYIFIETPDFSEAQRAVYGVPYARGLLHSPVNFDEIQHMLEQVKKDVNIKKNDVAEIVSGPFKREKCKITRVDKTKEEVVVELLEAAVSIPITLKFDSIKIIRREDELDDDLDEDLSLDF